MKYSKMTIFLSENNSAVLAPGKEDLGEDIQYGGEGETTRATAIKHIDLPREMEKEELDEWMMEQREDENSYIQKKIKEVKRLYG